MHIPLQWTSELDSTVGDVSVIMSLPLNPVQIDYGFSKPLGITQLKVIHRDAKVHGTVRFGTVNSQDHSLFFREVLFYVKTCFRPWIVQFYCDVSICKAVWPKAVITELRRPDI